MKLVSLLWLLLFWLWTLAELLLLLRTRQPGRDRGTLRLLWTTVALSITIGQFLRGFLGPSRLLAAPAVHLRIQWIALLLLLVGTLLRLLAIRTLGRAFSVHVAVRTGQQVVQHGLYAHLRHPSYTALLLILFATGLQTANFAALALTFLPPLAALLRRIHVEEQVLANAFGPSYADYCRRVPHRLIPGLW